MNGWTSRAILADGRGGFTLERIEVAPPTGRDVVVRIRASGICHTDFDHMRSWYREPTVLGHEGAGEVVAFGDGVDDLAIGAHVLTNWAMPCGQCFQCARGAEAICEDRAATQAGVRRFDGSAVPASFGLGTMSEYVIVPRAALVAIPADVPFAPASIVGCAVLTGFGAAAYGAPVEAGDTVVVIGAGGVGLNVIAGARYRDAARIIAVDRAAAKLEAAQRFGATESILADPDDRELRAAAAQVRESTSGRGADVAFECTAVPALGPAPLRFIRNGGTAIGVSGIEETIPVDMELFEWDKRYVTVLYGATRAQRDVPLILELYRSGTFDLDALVTRTYTLEDLDRAFDDLRKGRNLKGVVLV
jgi:S-(hydroxymethyl)glutathione dehydrogenase / alcohol dehydrogenase